MATPSVKEVLTDWLKVNGYDGLFNEGICGCCVDDLMPCHEPSPDCQAGYMVSCCECHDQEHCSMGQEYDYLISPKKGTCSISEGDEV